MPTCITRRPRQPPERWAFSGPGDFEPILAQLGANGGAIFNADAFAPDNADDRLRGDRIRHFEVGATQLAAMRYRSSAASIAS